MNEVRDHSVLKWIKPELDASLATARQALEAYIDEDAPETELDTCIDHLHQVRGTLQLMQLYGAAMLAEEMEQVASVLSDLGEKKRKDSAEALMIGLAQLPDYLEKVEAGSMDNPLLLLPLMNELRASRDAALLSEVALFTPDLDVRLGAGEEVAGNPELPAIARKLRLQYHKALLNWYRDIDPEAGLKRIGDIFQRLEERAASDVVRRTFQVARSTVAALQDRSIASGIATKLLVGKVDREIKRLIDGGEELLAREPANDLLKNLLYYTACADSSAEVVRQVKQEFDLDETLLSQVGTGQDINAPGRELLDSLRSAISTDLTAVKDQLDLFIRSKSGDLGRLQALQEPIKKLADTLGMVGQGELRSRLVRQSGKIGEIVASGTYPSEQDLMAMASDILFIETSLNNLSIVRRYTAPQDDRQASSLPAGEFERLVDSVMHEAGVDLAHNKEAIIQFIGQPDQSSLLTEVPRRFRDIAGAFRVLTLDDAAQLMERLNHYVESALLGSSVIPSTDDLDAFADAVTGIEYYMEAVTEGRGIHPEILEVTRDALARLAVPDLATPEAEAPDDSDVVETVEPVVHVATDEVLDDTPAPGVSDERVEVGSEPGSEAQAQAQPVASVDKPALEDIDPEILEIFIEEAEEELAVIQEHLPRWSKNQDDQDALSTFRRSFHTLKGSGRLVGAKVIGEYAWSVENLLNRLIDGTVKVTPELIELLHETLNVLPRLIESQKQGVAPDIDVEPLIRQADAMARPGSTSTDVSDAEPVAEASAEEVLDSLEESIDSSETLDFGTPEPEAEELSDTRETEAEPESRPESKTGFESEFGLETDEALPVADQPEVITAPIVLDETLLEIFAAESETHIETLSRFCDDCSGDPRACRLGKELVRALHTLHGSAEMSGVDPIAQVSTALESLVAELSTQGRHADTAMLDLIRRSVVLFKQILSAINVPGAELPDWDALVGEIRGYKTRSDTPSERSVSVSDDETPAAAEEAATVITPIRSLSVESGAEPELAPETVLIPEEESAPEFVSEAGPASEPVPEPETEPGPESKPEIELGPEPEPVSDAVLASELAPEPVPGLESEPELTSRSEPPVEPIVPAPDTARMVELDGDPDLVEIFLEEARELHEALENTLQEGAGDLADSRVTESLQRTLHTLKGGARLAGAMPIGDLSHGFESLLSAVDQKRVAPGGELLALTHEVVDRLAEQIDDLAQEPRLRVADDLVAKMEAWLQQGGPVTSVAAAPAAEPAETESRVEDGVLDTSVPTARLEPETAADTVQLVDTAIADPVSSPEIAAEADDALSVNVSTQGAGSPASGEASLSVATEETARPQQLVRGQREQVRVRSDLLDRLVNYAGEVSIYRTRIEQQNGQLGFNLGELEQTISRLRDQLRTLEIETEAQILFRYEQDRESDASLDASFDPLELDRFSAMQQVSRSLMETVNDLSNINHYLEDLQSETDTLLLQQSRITTDLQDGLMRTRMVPFSQIVARLHRVVRQTCNQLKKQAELEIQGAESEIDRGILERMIGPLEHILRNAIAHGIETPAERSAKGKSDTGRILLQLSREGSDVQLVISDDGGGVDMAKIRQQAIKSGLLDPQAEVSDRDVLPFVLEHGFSTAQEITQIAGRGVGLDVVVSEVKQLGGTLDIDSQSGQGTRFIIRLPLTLAITDALLVELAGEIYAIPHTSIEGVVRVSLQELEACYNGQQTTYRYAGQDYQVRYLGSMLNVAQADLGDQRKWYPLLLVRAGEHHVALQVDGMLGNRQIVVKSVGIQVATVRWISGGTILGDGRVALILDVTALVRSDAAHTAVRPPPEVAKAEVSAPEPGVGRTVMVVDDSITVRKVTGRLLERHGMNVLTAKDGVDAVAMLQEQVPDIMLLDIEMPRMDGYELARHMRNSEALKGVPIIMITSRTGEKHRNLAMELGVRRYLGKPYQENELLDNIYSVLDEEAG